MIAKNKLVHGVRYKNDAERLFEQAQSWFEDEE